MFQNKTFSLSLSSCFEKTIEYLTSCFYFVFSVPQEYQYENKNEYEDEIPLDFDVV